MTFAKLRQAVYTLHIRAGTKKVKNGQTLHPLRQSGPSQLKPKISNHQVW